jgi:hypothetical protein
MVCRKGPHLDLKPSTHRVPPAGAVRRAPRPPPRPTRRGRLAMSLDPTPARGGRGARQRRRDRRRRHGQDPHAGAPLPAPPARRAAAARGGGGDLHPPRGRGAARARARGRARGAGRRSGHVERAPTARGPDSIRTCSPRSRPRRSAPSTRSLSSSVAATRRRPACRPTSAWSTSSTAPCGPPRRSTRRSRGWTTATSPGSPTTCCARPSRRRSRTPPVPAPPWRSGPTRCGRRSTRPAARRSTRPWVDAAWREDVAFLGGFAGPEGHEAEAARRQAVAADAAPRRARTRRRPRRGGRRVGRAGRARRPPRCEEGDWRGPDLGAVKAALRRLRDGAREAWDDGDGPVGLVWSALDERAAAIVAQLRGALEGALAIVDERKRRAKALSFADLETHALRALEDPDVRAHVHRRWRALLVDEVQDVNPTQAALLAALRAADAPLTAVGDAKQSIYGFRGAEPAVLAGLQARVAVEGGGRTVALRHELPQPRRARRGREPGVRPRPGSGRGPAGGRAPAPAGLPPTVRYQRRGAAREAPARRSWRPPRSTPSRTPSSAGWKRTRRSRSTVPTAPGRCASTTWRSSRAVARPSRCSRRGCRRAGCRC